MLAKNFLIFLLVQNLTSMVETIYGGTPVQDFQFPWIVEVTQDLENSTKYFYCGGSIISKNVIMTAAHCVNRDKENKTSVLVGNSNLLSHQIRRIKVKSILIHPNYDSKAMMTLLYYNFQRTLFLMII